MMDIKFLYHNEDGKIGILGYEITVESSYIYMGHLYGSNCFVPNLGGHKIVS